MKEELQKQLQEKYPGLVKDDLDIECGDGWYHILDAMLHIIHREIKNNNIECHILQVKEKFGGLRFYMNGGNTFTDGVITMAEDLSYRICDVCGNSGDPKRKGGWVRTRCDVHA